jgi:hypothetical protein
MRRHVKREVAEFGSYLEAVEGFFAKPWSDGLPTVPPTSELVEAMIAGGGRDGDALVGTIPGRKMSLHVWQAATCAVMAGCRPDYFPVVLATWDALLAPRFNLHGVLSSTGGASIAAIVSGPYADTIGMNSGAGAFGPGNRANSTIGRAIRLGSLTAFHAIPGGLDASSYGHGGKYSFHFAETPPPAPWRSIREQLGYPAHATTVTVMSTEAPRQIMHRWNPSADDMLRTVASPMKEPSQNSTGSEAAYIVVLGPEHADVLIAAGLTQSQVRQKLSVMSAVSTAELAAAGIRFDDSGTRYGKPDSQGRIMTARPEHILVMTAGGAGAGWSMVIPPLTWIKSFLPSTRAVNVPGQPPVERDVAAAEPDLDFA